MALIKLLRIEDGDSQKNLTDKLNYNFQRVVSFGGGPYGRRGPKGAIGPKGPAGPIGSYGDSGIRGNIWTVGVCQPSIASSMNGDYWLDTASNNLVYQFSSTSGWGYYGFNIKSTDLFDIFTPLSTLGGPSPYSGYFISSQTPLNYTVVISDNELSGGTQDDSTPFVNPQYSKFVIAVDSTNTTKNLLEFTKHDYADDHIFSALTPRIQWDQSAISSDSNYPLLWKNGYFNMNLRGTGSTNGYLNIKSNIGSFIINCVGFNYSSSSNNVAIFNSSGNIEFYFGTGKSIFSNKNISLISDKFYINTSFNIETSTNDTGYALHAVSSNNNTNSGNFRYLYNSNGVSDAVLMNVYQNSPNYYQLFKVTGDGVTYMDKVVASNQTPQKLTQSGTGSVAGGNVNWVSVIPSITTTGFNSGCYYVNNGKNHIIGRSAAASSGDRGISLFTPATGGYLNGENGGWLNLLDNYESISFTIQSDDQYNDPSCFKYLALNSDYLEQRPPATGGYQYVDFGGYASTLDITIINMTGSGGTGVINRWFRVYYSAYLSTSQRICGVLSTFNSIAN